VDADSWNDRYRQKEFVWTVEPNGFLVDAVAGLPPGRALDLAAGEGRNAVWLASRGWTVTAVDWSDVALDKGRRRAEHAGVGVEWVLEDLIRWRSPGPAYDLVTIVYLQIPAEERRAIWREAAAAVAPGGRLVVIGHDSANLTDGYGGPSSPAVLYTAAEVAAAVDGLLDVERAETVLRPVEDEDGVLHEAIDNLTVAVRP
jgi:ubiquinone/menaquinone biosynthesis C-methylase UbiE